MPMGLKALVAGAVCALAVLFGLGMPASARADVGGNMPAPGLCDYPGVGGSGFAGALMPGYWYWCDFPTEINGSHWHCEELGAAGNTELGLSFLFFHGNLSGQIGGIVGGCSWRCPDLTMAAQPNPPGAWKDKIYPTECKTIGPNPNAPPPPPPDEGPVPPAPQPEDDAVTNPVFPNPLETENPR